MFQPQEDVSPASPSASFPCFIQKLCSPHPFSHPLSKIAPCHAAPRVPCLFPYLAVMPSRLKVIDQVGICLLSLALECQALEGRETELFRSLLHLPKLQCLEQWLAQSRCSGKFPRRNECVEQNAIQQEEWKEAISARNHPQDESVEWRKGRAGCVVGGWVRITWRAC